MKQSGLHPTDASSPVARHVQERFGRAAALEAVVPFSMQHAESAAVAADLEAGRGAEDQALPGAATRVISGAGGAATLARPPPVIVSTATGGGESPRSAGRWPHDGARGERAGLGRR